MLYAPSENLCVYVRPDGGMPDAGVADVISVVPPDGYDVHRDGMGLPRRHSEPDLFHLEYNPVYMQRVRYEPEEYQSFIRKVKWDVIKKGGSERYRCTIKFRLKDGGRISGMPDIVVY